jgi:hypothetical protein
MGPREQCFAWKPVRLYNTHRPAWFKPLYRRDVIDSDGARYLEYTDDPNRYPSGRSATCL